MDFSGTFVKKDAFGEGVMIIAIGNARSNDALFFIGDTDAAMPAHEFGHHLGNPDEYEGARVDETLNDDGAVNGIDEDSIMGQRMTTVKKRHFRLLLKVFAERVSAEHGKAFTYEVVAP